MKNEEEVSLKEVLVAIGLVFVLGGACAAIWSASVVVAMDRAEEQSTYFDPWYGDPWEDDSPLDRMRTVYSAVLVCAIVVLIAGIGLTMYGLRETERETDAAMSAPHTVPGSKNFCQYCGGFVDTAAVRCPSCGRNLAEG